MKKRAADWLAGGLVGAISMVGLFSVGPLSAASPGPIVLQPGEQVTIIAAAPSATPATSPSVTVAPTPTPTATPTPAPTPTPRPNCDVTFGAPTGADQSSAINSFLAANTAKRVCFQPGATYTAQARIQLNGWTGTILGQGATIRRTSSSAQYEQLRFVQSHDVVVDGLNVTGPATLANIQSRVFGSGDQEDEHAFGVESVAGFVLRNSTVTGTWGDAVYLRSVNYNGDDSPTSNVTIDNVVANVIGRNCVSVISVTALTVSRVRCSNVSLHGFDAEPNRSSDVVSDVVVTGSDWRAFDAGHTPSGPGYAIVLTPGGADVASSGIAITANTMDKPRVRVDGYGSTAPARDVLVTGNRPDVSGAATFAHVRGFTFSDNGAMTASVSDVQ